MLYRSIRMEYSTINAPRPAPEAEEVYRRWIQFLDEEFTRHQAPELRSEIVRDQLCQLYLGRPHGGKLNLTLTSELPGNVVSLSLDPENVTLEAEHFVDADPALFAARKPLLWFWQMFDRSPVGMNHWLGLRFRAMLGRHLFARIGAGVKIYHGVELTFGYNLAIEEGAPSATTRCSTIAAASPSARARSSAPSPASIRTRTPFTTSARSRWPPPSSARRRASPATPSYSPDNTSELASWSAASPPSAHKMVPDSPGESVESTALLKGSGFCRADRSS